MASSQHLWKCLNLHGKHQPITGLTNNVNQIHLWCLHTQTSEKWQYSSLKLNASEQEQLIYKLLYSKNTTTSRTKNNKNCVSFDNISKGKFLKPLVHTNSQTVWVLAIQIILIKYSLWPCGMSCAHSWISKKNHFALLWAQFSFALNYFFNHIWSLLFLPLEASSLKGIIDVSLL